MPTASSFEEFKRLKWRLSVPVALLLADSVESIRRIPIAVRIEVRSKQVQTKVKKVG